MFYTTIENQLRNDGSYGLLYNHYENIDDAYAKLYSVLAEAAKSGIPYHSCHIMADNGVLIEGRVFDRRTSNE